MPIGDPIQSRPDGAELIRHTHQNGVHPEFACLDTLRRSTVAGRSQLFEVADRRRPYIQSAKSPMCTCRRKRRRPSALRSSEIISVK